MEDIHSLNPTGVGLNNDISIRPTRNLPRWLWLTIARSLGIKINTNEKPILSSIFYVLTYASCFGLVITTFWFTVYDIISDYTKTSIIDGTITIIYTIFWCALGVYAHKLSFRLFSHPHFLKLVKLHSKTILKMNTAVLLFLLMTLFIIINNINGHKSFENDVCQTVGLEVIICKLRYVFRVLFSLFTLLWNYLVAFALISVCRSHVIRIRKFMKVLEQDSVVYETHFLGMNAKDSTTPLEEYTWVEENYLDELHDLGDSDLYHRQRTVSSSEPDNTSVINVGGEIASHAPTINPVPEVETNIATPERNFQVTPSLSNDEILFNYWKIQSDLRISSVALQRWMISVIGLVAIWLALNLVLWLNHDPNLIEIVNFFLPLLLLPLLSSAYAEVNQEGLRLLKFICLTESRLQLLWVLQSCPLQMTLYSFSLSYQTIGTASLGLLVALASNILIQKFFK